MSFLSKVQTCIKVVKKVATVVASARPMVEAFREKSKQGSFGWKAASAFCVVVDTCVSLKQKIDSSLNSLKESLVEILETAVAPQEEAAEVSEEPALIPFVI